MDTLIISKENNIIHVCKDDYKVDYTIYDCKGHLLDGGILESIKGKFDNDKVINEIITLVKDNFSFSSPYMYLSGEKAEPLLELIQMEDYKNMQKEIDSFANKSYDDSFKNIER